MRQEPQIGLHHNQSGDNSDDNHDRDIPCPQIAQTFAFFGDQGSQVENDRDLGQLGRLNPQGSDTHPALGAVNPLGGCYEQQEDEGNHEDRCVPFLKFAVVDVHDHEHDEAAQHGPNHLLFDEEKCIIAVFLARKG